MWFGGNGTHACWIAVAHFVHIFPVWQKWKNCSHRVELCYLQSCSHHEQIDMDHSWDLECTHSSNVLQIWQCQQLAAFQLLWSNSVIFMNKFSLLRNAQKFLSRSSKWICTDKNVWIGVLLKSTLAEIQWCCQLPLLQQLFHFLNCKMGLFSMMHWLQNLFDMQNTSTAECTDGKVENAFDLAHYSASSKQGHSTGSFCHACEHGQFVPMSFCFHTQLELLASALTVDMLQTSFHSGILSWIQSELAHCSNRWKRLIILAMRMPGKPNCSPLDTKSKWSYSLCNVRPPVQNFEKDVKFFNFVLGHSEKLIVKFHNKIQSIKTMAFSFETFAIVC